jgi:deoxyribodipyrimidine photolyase-related protein
MHVERKNLQLRKEIFNMAKSLRHLVLILGDQLNLDSTALADFDPTQDIIWMAEVMEESTHVASSKQRSTLFLSAMRHFAEAIKAKAWPLVYTQLSDADNMGTLAGELDKAIQKIRPQKLLMTAPGGVASFAKACEPLLKKMT